MRKSMALKSSIACLIFFFFFSLISILSSSSSYQLLDVSASLQQARQILSPKSAHTDTEQPRPFTSSSHSLSLTLVSRSSLPSAATATNYTTLTLSRLAGDEAHVRSLLSRLSVSLSKHSNLESPVISGLSRHNGEYFARVGVGRPAAELYMTIDTGSDVTWLQCKPCVHCYPQSDPVYDPKASSTYARLHCLTPQCAALDPSACLLGGCVYQVLYGDASYTAGDFVTETISFGSSGSVANVAVGCGHENFGLFSGAAGLLGLGGGEVSLPAQIKATSFSYCLVDRDSNASSTLDFNSTRPDGDDSAVAPLLDNAASDTYRYFGLSGISVGGEAVKFPPSLLEMRKDGGGGVIIDSGTTVTRLRRAVYYPVRDAFRNMSRELPFAGGYLLFDTCYDLSSLSEAKVPAMSFKLSGGDTVALRPKNYMIPVDDGGKFCFAFAGMAGSLSIIGNVQQQGMRVTYDLLNKNIAFSPSKC